MAKKKPKARPTKRAPDERPDERPAPAQVPTIIDPLPQVFAWVIEGQAESSIVDAIRATWPGRDPKELLDGVLQQLVESGACSEEQNQLLRGWCIEATRELYRRMVHVGDFTGALAAIKTLHKLTS